MSEQQQAPVKPVLSASAAKRANASVRGMILALAVSILAFVPILLLNAYPKADTYERNIDVGAVAADLADVAGYSPVVPNLPEEWTSNFARWNAGSTSGVPHWEVGYVTGGEHFIALTQTSEANPTWLAQQTDNAPVVGEREIAGENWQIRHRPEADRSLVLEAENSTVVLSGTAPDEEFDLLATRALNALDEEEPA